MNGDVGRPADAARRALRAARARDAQERDARERDARERDERQAKSPTEQEVSPSPHGGGRAAPEEPAAQEARPGDVAREALRRAARGEPVQGDTQGPEEPWAEGHTVEPAATPSPRPGDIAREALRAARQVRSEVKDEEVRPSRRTTGPTLPRSRARRNPGNEERGGPVRELRELLAGTFEPPAAHEPGEATPQTPQRHDAPPHHDAPRPHDEPPPFHTSAPHATPPTAPHVPRSMAAPTRDTELRRTFAAFPPRSPAPGDTGRFAGTWWGNAWVTALEEGALDAARLARGRAYAQQGHVDAITVTPGLVLGYVQGSRPRPYRAQVRLRTLSDADWDRFLDAAAERPGHIAALLDKEMPQSLAECGVRLLPGPGDLEPHCSCPDSGHPCKHAAALCYQTARLLDEDPFVLLLLRGRGERELLDALSRLSAARAARAAQDQDPAPLPGIRATDALAARTLPPLPAPLPPPPHPEQPPVYPGAPGGPDPFALDQLATDAAARAHALLTTGRDPVAELTLWQDAVRLAAARPGSGLTAGTRALYSSLTTATGRTPADLARAVAAWRQGGPEGLAVLEEPWDPPAGRFDRARPLLLAADLPAFRPRRNHLTHPHGHIQLRLGRDGLWYAYESEPGREDWWPRGTPDLDPVGALTGLGAAGDV
ncbi:SWIM zinc finger family protein [Streptomyces acidicola]|uniref:SWIM zinc finger family protein n=1 Tax=Streptomyces acidicola TaxID=2596892 RepID=UPI00381B9D46